MNKMNKFLLPLLLLLSSCSGGSLDLVEGGIGGTGIISIGEISAFGSVYVNGVHYNTDSTQVLIDGYPSDLSQLELGMVVQVTGNANQQQGIADTIQFSPTLQGTIQAIDINNGRLQVLGNTVVCDDLTVLADFNDLTDLHIHDIVIISGLVDETGYVYAKRIQRETQTNQIVLRGVLQDYNATNASGHMQGQALDFNHVLLTDVVLETGLNIVVKGVVIGDVIQVAQVALYNGMVQAEQDKQLHLKGLVNTVNNNSLYLNGIPIETTNKTTYEFGQAQDLSTGINISVHASSQYGLWVADSIIFHDNSSVRSASNQIQLQAQIIDSPNSDKQSLRLFGQTLSVDFETLFMDKQQRYFDLSHLNSGDWVMLQGAFNHQNQQIMVEKLVRKPHAGNNIQLRAPITQIDSQQQTLSLANIAVYTDTNTQYHVINNTPKHFNSWLKTVSLPSDDAGTFFQHGQVNAQVWLINQQNQTTGVPILAEKLILFTHLQ